MIRIHAWQPKKKSIFFSFFSFFLFPPPLFVHHTHTHTCACGQYIIIHFGIHFGITCAYVILLIAPPSKGHDNNMYRIVVYLPRIETQISALNTRKGHSLSKKVQKQPNRYDDHVQQAEKQKSSSHDKNSFEGMGSFSGTGLTVNAGPAYLPFCCCCCCLCS